MICIYRVEIETDKETGEIVASIPTLKYTADFGGTVEETIERLSELAMGFVETLIEEGEPIPPSDRLMWNDLYLSLEIEQRAKVA